jgi:hypothetical protein
MGFPIVQTTYYFSNSLVALINPTLAAPVLLSAAKIMLGTTPITPSVTTNYASLTEAAFTGYAQSATVVWGAPVNELDGSQTALSPSHLFRCTASGTPEVISNFAVTDGVAPTATGILGSALINPGVPIQDAGDGFSLTVAWNLGPASANCEGTITS